MSKIYKALQKAEKGRSSTKEDTTPIGLHFPQGSDDICNQRLVSVCDPQSFAAEQFRKLKSTILEEFDETGKRCFLVTSAVPGEGKTLVAVNLATSLAQELQKYVLLIEADLRRPSIHTMLGVNGSRGLSDYLTGDEVFEKVLCKTTIPHLSFVAAGASTSRSAELISSDKMRTLLKDVKDRYDDRFIIVDSTPIIPTSEADILSREAEKIILVVKAGKTPREAVKRCLVRLDKDKILGVVLNGMEPQKLGYSYGYYRYSGYNYDKDGK